MSRLTLVSRLAVLSTHLAAASALILAIGGPAQAATIMINNGSAPPNAANVINHGLYQWDDPVYVRNVGCPFGWPAALPDHPCASPGAPTEVGVVDGGYAYGLLAYDSSTVTMSGGELYQWSAYDSSTITVSSGTVGYLTLMGSSVATISGGSLGSLGAYDSSTLIMSGGSVATNLSTYDFSNITMSEGSAHHMNAYGSSTFTMSGGSVEVDLFTYDSSTITISGGTVGNWLWAADSSVIEIDGSDFMVDGAPVPYGDLSAVFGTLTGTLGSGDPISNIFYQGGFDGGGGFVATGTIRLVPEPSTASLLALGLVGMAAAQRRRTAA